jgi:hypothetical protein
MNVCRNVFAAEPVKPAGLSTSACGPKGSFKVRKEPFGLRYRSPAASPFGLSLSKPFALGTKASTGSAWPFDKLRANGAEERTVVNSRNGLQADALFMHLESRQMQWIN